MFFFVGALPIDQSKIKHTKKLKEIPSRHVLENLPEKASIYDPLVYEGLWKIAKSHNHLAKFSVKNDPGQ